LSKLIKPPHTRAAEINKSMTLEQQVVSLDLSKKLKELDVKQESLFYWNYCGGEKERETWRVEKGKAPISGISAFTVAELGEMLPDYIQQEDGTMAQLTSTKHRPFWVTHYQWGESMQLVALYRQTADSEADARAQMLIYLLENKLIQLS
jgi:hypothetical protein